MVTGDPEPTITWYYNGQPLNSNVYLIKLSYHFAFRFCNLNFSLISVDGKKYRSLADGLLIKNILKKDSGEYTCKAFQISSALSNVEEKTIRLNIQR